MNIFRAVILLFLLNLIDAVLTLVWVRNGVASEANGLMSGLLDIGDFPFLFVKIGIGTLAALVLWKGADHRLARIGVNIALVAYVGAMGSHVFAGLAALGYLA